MMISFEEISDSCVNFDSKLRYNRLKKIIKNVTIDEILNQYNSHCFEKNWTDELNIIYVEELLERILSEATFSITTVWRSVKEWKLNPYMIVQLGFDESYPVIDDQNEILHTNDPVAMYYVLNNDKFPEEEQRELIFKFLTKDVKASVAVEDDRIYLNDILVETNVSENIELTLKVHHTPELHIFYMLLDNLWKKNYEIIDLHSRYIKRLDEENIEYVSLPPVEELIEKDDPAFLWKKIHISGLKCKNVPKYTEWIWEICVNLPCSECKWHMIDYINKNPIEDDIFRWTWKFHNEVNKRLGKMEYPYEQAYNFYMNFL